MRDILKYVFPEVRSEFGTNGIIIWGGYIAFMFIKAMFIMLLFFDFGILDPWLTGKF